MTEPREDDELGDSEEPGVDEKEAAAEPAEPVEGAEDLPTDVKDGTIEDHADEP
jgi:hypothetical protein